jgi:hypothetical protein
VVWRRGSTVSEARKGVFADVVGDCPVTGGLDDAGFDGTGFEGAADVAAPEAATGSAGIRTIAIAAAAITHAVRTARYLRRVERPMLPPENGVCGMRLTEMRLVRAARGQLHPEFV